MRKLFAITFCLIVAAAYGQNFSIENYKPVKGLVFLVQSDTVFQDSLPASVTISKSLMTRAQAKDVLFQIADRNKQVLEAQDEAQAQFDRLKDLFEAESGESYEDNLKKSVLQNIQGEYVLTYQNASFPISIKGNKLSTNDTTSFAIEVVDRRSFTAKRLFGNANGDVTFKIQQNRFLGEYRKRPVLIRRRE